MKKITVLSISIFLLFASFLYSKILVVDDNYPFTCEEGTCKSFLCIGPFGRYNFRNIKDAIKNANSGDTIKICKGNYYDSVIVDIDDLTITSGIDVKKPNDVLWHYNGNVLQIGSWQHYTKNFKLENISLESDKSIKNNNTITILKATKKITFENLILKTNSGDTIYSGYNVNKNLDFVFKNLEFKLKKGRAIIIDKAKNLSFDNIKINIPVTDFAIFTGWSFERNANLNFKKVKITLEEGSGIKISKAKKVSFDNVSIEKTTNFGILLDSGILGDITFKDINIFSNKGYNIYIASGKDLFMQNVKLTNNDNNRYSLKFDWGLYGNYTFDKIEINSKYSGVDIAKGKNVTINNLILNSQGSYNNFGLKFEWNRFNTITINNSQINSNGTGIIVNGAKNLEILYSKFYGKGKSTIQINTNVKRLTLKNSCIFNESTDSRSYGINIYNWQNNININNNCIFSKYGYYARDSKANHNWNGNYWDKIIDTDKDGDIDYFDSDKIDKWVRDRKPLKTCPNSCSETTQLLTPVINYQMDECFWDGTQGEVIDNSSNHFNGTGENGITTTTGKLCRSGEFDGIDDYIKTDNIFQYLKGTASLSFWIKTTQKGNNVAWRAPGITGVEQFGGRNDIFWGWIDAKGHIGISKGDNYNNSKSITPINNNKWHHIVLTRNASNGVVKIYIDGKLDKEGTTDSGIVTTYFHSIGEISNTNPRVKNIYFKGEIDELKIFNKILSDAEVKQIFLNESSGKNFDGTIRNCNNCTVTSALDHFEINDSNSDNQAIACEPELICFTAKDKDNKTLYSYTGEIKISSFLNHLPKGKWYKEYSGYINSDSPKGNILNEGNSVVSYYFQEADKGNFCLFLTDKEVVDNSDNLKIVLSSATGNIENYHYITFYKSAFKLLWENDSQLPWNKQISCEDSSKNPKTGYSKLYISALGTNDIGECENLFNGNMDIKARIIYLNPEPGKIIDNPTLLVNGEKVSYQKDDNPDRWNNINLEFKNGKAELNLLYKDAGQIKLQFAYDLDKLHSGYEINTINSNNDIIFSPFAMLVSFKNIDSKPQNNISSFNTKLKAGRDFFQIDVKGVCYDSSDDKSPKDGIPDTNANLSDNVLPLKNFNADVKLLWEVANPDNGTGKLLLDKISKTNFENGIGSIKTTFSDVGILSIYKAVASDYISNENNILGWPLYKNIGRFIPDHFAIDNISNGILKENCSTFNYSGDVLTYLIPPSFKIIAQNKDNKTTENYRNNFDFLTAENINFDYPSEDKNQIGNIKPVEIKIIPASGKLEPLANGIFKCTFGFDNITYLKNDNSKISPFAPKFLIGITQISDNDNVNAIELPKNISVSGKSIKYGMVKISDNYGPEIENLKMILKSFYWDNNKWKLNTDDSCTKFNNSDFFFKNFTDNLKSGDTAVINVTPITNGLGSLTLSAPGKDNYGSVDVDFNSKLFLHEDNSKGKATFGIYRGRDRIIMWEEVPVH